MTTSQGELELDIPRDREGDFEPQLIKRYQTRFDGIDDKILSLYAREMSVRDIQSELSELYGAAVSTTLISHITNAVIDEVKAWQSRPLDELFQIVYLDYLVVKVREDKRIINKAVYLSLGVNAESIYGVNTLDEAEMTLVSFAEKWDAKYLNISQSWQRDWGQLTPFFSYPHDIRHAIYTTNAIESLNMSLRKVIKNKRVFPSEDAVFKLIYLAIHNIAKKWTMPIHNWVYDRVRSTC